LLGVFILIHGRIGRKCEVQITNDDYFIIHREKVEKEKGNIATYQVNFGI